MTISPNNLPDLDLVVDLNSEDESGLPWAFIDEAHRPGPVSKHRQLLGGRVT